jgi:predicted dehydrogenase
MDYAQATFRMKSGLIAKLIGTWAHPQGFRVEVEVCGDNGMIQFNSDETSMTLMKRGKPGEGPGVIVPGNPVPVSPYELEWRDFLSCIEGKAQARVTPEDALMAVKMALAALKSVETGKPVKI